MSTQNPHRTGSLILYKNRPGRVTQTGQKKIEIQLDDGSTLSVRPKDITRLHPGPVRQVPPAAPPEGEILVAWELLAGSSTTLEELSELAFETFTPATAWAIWQLVADGLYFSGEPGDIQVHAAGAVAAEKESRATKAAAEAAWHTFLERLAAHTFDPVQDEEYLQDVVALARGERETSRVLAALEQSESPEAAHALLLACGYWDETVNPYPARAQLPTTPLAIPLDPLPAGERRDLTHLRALAIDDAGSNDPDDALSQEGDRLWVHIADVAALIPPDSPADRAARERSANLYLPEQVVHMLPAAATEMLALGRTDPSPALSFGLDLSPTGEIVHLEIVPSWVRVTRLTYAEAEVQLDDDPLLARLHALAAANMARRAGNGGVNIDLPEVKVRVATDGQVEIEPLPNLRSRGLVREAMLLAGEAVARFALDHQIPIAFSVQEPPDEEVYQLPAGPAGMFARRRFMRRSRLSNTPQPHSGLGLDTYTQCTSPLRRYLDLVAHQQLRHFAVHGSPLLDESDLMERVGAAEAVSREVRWTERRANEHWTLVYLQQHPEWQGAGIVVDQRGGRSVVLLPDLGLETGLYLNQEPALNQELALQVTGIDLPHLTAHFSLAANSTR
jgi:exoribonuclease-2